MPIYVLVKSVSVYSRFPDLKCYFVYTKFKSVYIEIHFWTFRPVILVYLLISVLILPYFISCGFYFDVLQD